MSRENLSYIEDNKDNHGKTLGRSCNADANPGKAGASLLMSSILSMDASYSKCRRYGARPAGKGYQVVYFRGADFDKTLLVRRRISKPQSPSLP